MGKIEVTCPDCGKIFEAPVLDAPYYEELVAQWTNGKTAKSKIQRGYDVSVEIGNKLVTIQVKHSNLTNIGNGRRKWGFYHSITKILPDYFVLFGVSSYGFDVFLMSFTTFMDRATRKHGEYHNGINRHYLGVEFTKSTFIWNYHVDNPERNLLPRIKAMISDRQLGLWQ